MLQQMPRKASSASNNKQRNSADRIPNIYWRSITTERLRFEERFVALPPVATLPSTKRHVDYRYVRQDSVLWRELHDGMLTTGRLKQALGMHEAKVASIVGIHPGSRGSSHLQSAYMHLLETAASSSSSAHTSSSSSDAAAAANEEARQQFNQQLAATAAADLPAGAAPATASLTDLQAQCQRVAFAGDLAVKLAWGKVQEAASLYCLLQLFPEAAVEEVGLFTVSPEEIPPSWGLGTCGKALPHLGASPDGLIVHEITFPVEDLQAAAQLLRTQATAEQQVVQQLLSQGLDRVRCTGTHPPRGVPVASSDEEDTEPGGCGSSSDKGAGDAAAAAAAATEVATAVSSGSSSSSGNGEGSAGLSVSSFQFDKLAIIDTLSSDCPAAAAESVGTQLHAAGMQASTISSTVSGTSSSYSAAVKKGAGGLAFEPVGKALLQLLHSMPPQQQQQQQPGHSGGSSSSSNTVRTASTSSSRAHTAGSQRLFIREVVEVKNHCPFAFRSIRKGKKGRLHVAFGWQARGPMQRVHPQWVPQLQLHMMVTGCHSALLVSRCPDKGVRVFRLWRDDSYLQTMLQLLAVLQTEHVLPGVPPTSNTFAQVPGYRAFLHRTAALARSAVCIAAAGEDVTANVPAAEDGSNTEKFWCQQV